MTNSSTKMGFQIHARSISLPSRPKPDSFNLQSNPNLKNLEFPYNSKIIQTNTLQLANLYNSVQDLLDSPKAQKLLLKHQNSSIVEEALQDSIELLDSCSAIADLYSAMKENVQNLQSAMRKRVTSNCYINAYLSFRKKAKKEAIKGIRALNRIQNKNKSYLQANNIEHNHLVLAIIRMSQQVSAFTIDVLETFFSYIVASSTKANGSHWSSLISKIRGSIDTKGETEIKNEAEFVDFVLKSHIKRRNSKLDVQMSGMVLEELHGRIQEFEDRIHSLQRLLIQHRVFLLNILSLLKKKMEFFI